MLAAGVALAGAFSSGSASAQGNLSTQGFGYPLGQLSARAEGTGGAIAEIDPGSPLNPAALIGLGTTTLFFQIEPEFRRVTVAGVEDRTTTARYPLVFAAFPIGTRWMLGLSSATLLDRTWSTSTHGTQNIGGDTVTTTVTYRVDGSINDVRLAGAFIPVPWFRAGFAGHVLSGSNRIFVGRQFADTTRFAPFAQNDRTISFSGSAVSAGVELIAPGAVSLALSARRGGTVRASAGDTALSSARAPDRFGASLAYIGIAGTTIAARTSLDKWSSLGPLGLGATPAEDAWDSSLGADIAGPRFGDRVFMLRAGARWRTLPFRADGNAVTEKTASVGIGTAFANGRAGADLSVLRATRHAAVPVSEHAWTMSLGLTIRP
jgi:hypothetical protein